MADAAIAPTTVDSSKAIDESTRTAESTESSTVAEAKPADGGDVGPADAPAQGKAPETASPTDDQAEKNESADAKPATTIAESNEDVMPVFETSASNGTPISAKKANNNRRKSTSGIPEHKSKKTPSKKKTKELHLHTKPGDMWMVAMRGYQPWPVIIADEDMLPESLLSKRPVSAKRLDGTYREDFRDDGKNVKDRRFPVMFLGTNEFAWQANYDLLPYNEDEVKKEVELGNTTKKKQSLWDAYLVAAEGHDLDYFKNILSNHEQAMQEDALEKEAKAEQKAKKADKAAKRKSTAGDVSDDIGMEDTGDTAPSARKSKASKKRKKEDDSDGEPEKPAKTPKQKLKLNNKPKEASATKPKKESKPKKGRVSEDEATPAPVEEPPMTEAERLAKRGKSVLYLRHRLQKGFISRDQAPKEEDMLSMSTYLKQLEELPDLEAEIIKNTKVHKVLRAIIRLETIPNEEDYNFKTRSSNLLAKWNSALAAETETADASASAVAPATNGVKNDARPEKTEDAPAAPGPVNTTDGDGDVAMTETKDETPAVQSNAGPGREVSVDSAATGAA